MELIFAILEGLFSIVFEFLASIVGSSWSGVGTGTKTNTKTKK